MAPINSLFPPPRSASKRVPDWQSAYKSVFTETDTAALFKLMEVAESAIRTRRASLEGSSDHHSERHAMEVALANLLVVKRERLRFEQRFFPD